MQDIIEKAKSVTLGPIRICASYFKMLSRVRPHVVYTPDFTVLEACLTICKRLRFRAFAEYDAGKPWVGVGSGWSFREEDGVLLQLSLSLSRFMLCLRVETFDLAPEGEEENLED